LDARKRFTEEQIIGFLNEADAGVAIKELCLRGNGNTYAHCLAMSESGASICR